LEMPAYPQCKGTCQHCRCNAASSHPLCEQRRIEPSKLLQSDSESNAEESAQCSHLQSGALQAAAAGAAILLAQPCAVKALPAFPPATSDGSSRWRSGRCWGFRSIRHQREARQQSRRDLRRPPHNPSVPRAQAVHVREQLEAESRCPDGHHSKPRQWPM